MDAKGKARKQTGPYCVPPSLPCAFFYSLLFLILFIFTVTKCNINQHGGWSFCLKENSINVIKFWRQLFLIYF